MMCRKLLLFCILFTLISGIANAIDDWSMSRHDLNHTGYSTSQINASELVLRWSYTIAGDQISSSPAVSGGVIYVASYYDKKVYALNASTGIHIWNYTTEYWVDSSPTISSTMIFVGSVDGKVYAFGPRETQSILLLLGWNLISIPLVV